MLEQLTGKFFNSRKWEYIVQTYGADFLSTYVAGGLLSVSAVFSQGAAPFIAIPVAAGLVSYINQLNHDYKERELLEFYRDPVSSRLGIDPATLTLEQFHAYAYSHDCPNNVLTSEMENNDRQRNFAIGFHVASGIIFGAIAMAVLPLLGAIPLLSPLMNTLVQAGAGLGALMLFQQIDRMVTDIGGVIFDVNHKTAHQNLVEMQDALHSGQQVSSMQVFAVMLAADDELSARVKQEFGGKFDDLYLSDKYKAIAKYGPERGVEELATALNQGRIEAEGLAFTMCTNPETLLKSLPEAPQATKKTPDNHFQDQLYAERDAALAAESLRQMH